MLFNPKTDKNINLYLIIPNILVNSITLFLPIRNKE